MEGGRMESETTGTATSVIVVEDEPLIAANIQDLLEQMGHTVLTTVSDGREAVAAAGRLHPDLVLMDIGLEGEMDGIEAAATLYEQLGIPVVFLTGSGDAATINRAARARPFGYLIKPFSEAELRGALEVAIARHRAEAELQHREKALMQYARSLRTRSLIDELTGLYNRRGFLTLAQHLLRASQRHGRSCVVLFIDLDGFKRINDSQGHAAGDQTLRDLAGILTHTFRKSDVVARLGGDEFVVLAVESASAGGISASSRLRAALLEHNEQHPRDLPIAVSIGVAMPDPDVPEPIEALVERADAEMYKEKKRAVS